MLLTDIKGIGARRAELLAKMQILRMEDLLFYYPYAYLDDSNIVTCDTLKDGDEATVRVELISDPSVFYNGKLSILSVRCTDGTGKLTLRWYNQNYRKPQIKAGMQLYATGKVNAKRGVAMVNPRLTDKLRGIVPLYRVEKGLSQTIIKTAVEKAFELCSVYETLPEELIARYELIPREQAVRSLHFPENSEMLRQAGERISFENALMYFLAMYEFKEERKRSNGIAQNTEGLIEKFIAKLPFTPTTSQMEALRTIDSRMSSPVPMNLLLQGDVGSGKTVVAEYALCVAAANGYQGVMLAPTEILARQHYRNMQTLFGSSCQLYVGGMSEHEKHIARERIRNGAAGVIIGTHALLNGSVAFFNLGVAITDEQHRFGVSQRARLANKGGSIDLLVMSATPIPRTLALLLYGDLDLVTIRELPKGRLPIKTRYIAQNKREAMYRYIAQRAAEEHEQAYAVCPLIEPAEGFEGLSVEELYEELTTLLPNTRIAVLHGRMDEAKKQSVMDEYKRGNCDLLISTTVIEVGIDVPNAVSMVIEGAERFGLATLHQLRGRVGRGSKQSYCYLLSEKSPKDNERLAVMLETTDGFLIAQRDLELRGAGDMLGMRQHGDTEAAFMLRGTSMDILQRAGEAARAVIDSPSAVNNELMRMATNKYVNSEEIVMN